MCCPIIQLHVDINIKHLFCSYSRPITVVCVRLLSIGENGGSPTHYHITPIYSNCVYVRENSNLRFDCTKHKEYFDTDFHRSVVHAVSVDRERTQ